MRHLECQLEEKNQELLRVSHGGGVVPGRAATGQPLLRERDSLRRP